MKVFKIVEPDGISEKETPMILPCCGHLEDRHLDLEDGRPPICLTGRCRCGRPKKRKKKPVDKNARFRALQKLSVAARARAEGDYGR